MLFFFTHVIENIVFGASQFAYRKKHGARDALLYYALSWVAALNDACKVGVYLCDVSGAFDKVDAELSRSKLLYVDLNQRLLALIRIWLRDRDGYVIVNCESSRRINLQDMVFQATVWGPQL